MYDFFAYYSDERWFVVSDDPHVFLARFRVTSSAGTTLDNFTVVNVDDGFMLMSDVIFRMVPVDCRPVFATYHDAQMAVKGIVSVASRLYTIQ